MPSTNASEEAEQAAAAAGRRTPALPTTTSRASATTATADVDHQLRDEQRRRARPAWSTAGAGRPSRGRSRGGSAACSRPAIARVSTISDGTNRSMKRWPPRSGSGSRSAEDEPDDHEDDRRAAATATSQVAGSRTNSFASTSGELGKCGHGQSPRSARPAGGRSARRTRRRGSACSTRRSLATIWLRARTAVTACSRLPVPATTIGGRARRDAADLGQAGEQLVVERRRRAEPDALLGVDPRTTRPAGRVERDDPAARRSARSGRRAARPPP